LGLASWGILSGPPAAATGSAPASVTPRAPATASHSERASRARLAAFGTCWALLGSATVLLPGVRFTPYYVLLRAVGAWLALAVALERMPAAALATVGVMAVLQPVHAATPAWYWGGEAYLRRTAEVVQSLEGTMLRDHPRVPTRSRFYFTDVPQGIG